jgi:hypothetical protein
MSHGKEFFVMSFEGIRGMAGKNARHICDRWISLSAASFVHFNHFSSPVEQFLVEPPTRSAAKTKMSKNLSTPSAAFFAL